MVFSGGGAFAAWEIGCLAAIVAREHGMPSTVIGTSAGAVNAAGVCSGYSPEELEAFWTGLRSRDVYRRRYVEWAAAGLNLVYHAARTRDLPRALRRAARQVQSIFDPAPLRDTFRRLFEDRVEAFFDSEMSFAVPMTDLVLGRSLTIYKEGKNYSGPSPRSSSTRLVVRLERGVDEIVDTLMGTTAIPLLFSPHEMKVSSGEILHCFDGGILRNCPIAPAVELGEKKIYVLVPCPAVPRWPSGIVDIFSSLLETWTAASFESQLELVAQINDAKRAARQEPIDVRTIRPAIPLETYGVGPFSFGEHVGEIVESGRRDAEESFARGQAERNRNPRAIIAMPARSA